MIRLSTPITRAKYVVCPACAGEGYVSNLGVFTGADVDEWYGDDWDAREDFVREVRTRGGAYDRPCDCCNGARVATPEQVETWDERRAEARWGY